MISFHLHIVTVLLLLFQLECILFIFSSLIAVARTSKAMLFKHAHHEHPCLVSDVREKAFRFLLLNMMLAVSLAYMTLIVLTHVLSIPTLLRVFMINRCCILWNAFPVFFEIMIFILSFVNVMYYCDWFIDIESSLYPQNKSQLIMCMIFLMYCWIWFANIL